MNLKGNNQEHCRDRPLDTIPRLLQFWSETQPDRELFVFYSGQVRQPYTSRRVFELSGKFAHRLRYEYGFKQGDVIVNSLPNSPERVITDLGILLAGCHPLTIITRSHIAWPLLSIARKSGARGVIVSRDRNCTVWKVLKEFTFIEASSCRGEIHSEDAPDFKTAVVVSRHPTGPSSQSFLEDLQCASDNFYVQRGISPDDMAVIFSTSGSTGDSKLVPVSHKDIFLEGEELRENYLKYLGCSRLINLVTFSDRTIGGRFATPFGTYMHADTRVLLDYYESQEFEIGDNLWDIIGQEKVLVALIMAAGIKSLWRKPPPSETHEHKLKLVVFGGAPVRKDHYSQCTRFTEKVAVCHGCTENGVVAIGCVHDTTARDFYCGKVIRGFQVKILDEKGKPCKAGKIGVLYTRGGNGAFKKYFNTFTNPEPTEEAVFTEDGWYMIRDIGFFDADDNMHIIGRDTDVINLNGVDLRPSIIESRIAELQEIDEVAVVPVRGGMLQQKVCVVVQPAPGSQMTEVTVQDWCQSLFVGEWKMDTWCYMILNVLPKTVTGKIDRFQLSKLAEDQFRSHVEVSTMNEAKPTVF